MLKSSRIHVHTTHIQSYTFNNNHALIILLNAWLKSIAFSGMKWLSVFTIGFNFDSSW